MIQFIGRHTANKLFLSGSSAVLPSFICIHEHPGGICELQIGLRQVVLLETASRVQCYITPSTTELSSELFTRECPTQDTIPFSGHFVCRVFRAQNTVFFPQIVAVYIVIIVQEAFRFKFSQCLLIRHHIGTG